MRRNGAKSFTLWIAFTFYGIPLPLRRLTSRKITAGTKAFQVFHTSRSVSVSLSFDLDFFQIEKCESIHAAKSRRVVLYFYSSQQPVKRQIVAIRRVIKIIQTAQESVPVNLFPLHAPEKPLAIYRIPFRLGIP